MNFNRTNVLVWMRDHRSEHMDRETGEVNLTTLAEAAADAFDQVQLGGPLDEENHWIWDMAIKATA